MAHGMELGLPSYRGCSGVRSKHFRDNQGFCGEPDKRKTGGWNIGVWNYNRSASSNTNDKNIHHSLILWAVNCKTGELIMDGQHHSDGLVSTTICMVSTIFAWISIKDVQTISAFIASLIAIVSGVMGIRYYYHATKKLK